jgi:hypothetical protein
MRLFEQQFCSVEDGLTSSIKPFEKKVHEVNPYFDVDHNIYSRSLSDCVARQLVDPSAALELMNGVTPVMYKDGYTDATYLATRAMSIKTHLSFNLLCRQRYREAFPTHFPGNPNAQPILEALQTKGFFVLPATEKSRACVRDIVQHLDRCVVQRELDGRIGAFDALVKEGLPGSFRYQFLEKDIPVAPAVGLYQDMGIVRAIGDYIGHPILRRACAWYSTRPDGYTVEDEVKSAQFYHFDNDTPAGWVKVFMYLTDVSDESGPHVFIPGSHKELPPELTRDGRFSDEEAERILGPGEVLKGEAGTIIVADTQGFHKGLTPQSGMRLVLQLEFVASLFGAETPAHGRPHEILASLKEFDSRFLRRYLRDIYR